MQLKINKMHDSDAIKYKREGIRLKQQQGCKNKKCWGHKNVSSVKI